MAKNDRSHPGYMATVVPIPDTPLPANAGNLDRDGGIGLTKKKQMILDWLQQLAGEIKVQQLELEGQVVTPGVGCGRMSCENWR
jgi:hypothetical protein